MRGSGPGQMGPGRLRRRLGMGFGMGLGAQAPSAPMCQGALRAPRGMGPFGLLGERAPSAPLSPSIEIGLQLKHAINENIVFYDVSCRRYPFKYDFKYIGTMCSAMQPNSAQKTL